MAEEQEYLKKCRICGEVLPITEFYKQESCADDYETKCKACKKLLSKYTYKRKTVNRQTYDRLRQKKKREEEEALRKAKDTLGGYKIYILNHPKDGEYSYNITSTEGLLFRTNDKKVFIEALCNEFL
jgi:hypothetical protein